MWVRRFFLRHEFSHTRFADHVAAGDGEHASCAVREALFASWTDACSRSTLVVGGLDAEVDGDEGFE